MKPLCMQCGNQMDSSEAEIYGNICRTCWEGELCE